MRPDQESGLPAEDTILLQQKNESLKVCPERMGTKEDPGGPERWKIRRAMGKTIRDPEGLRQRDISAPESCEREGSSPNLERPDVKEILHVKSKKCTKKKRNCNSQVEKKFSL